MTAPIPKSSGSPLPDAPPAPPDPDTLLEEYRWLVRSVARRHFPGRLWDQDLLQCGLIGLWQAALRWDGSRAFQPFASICIRNAMSDYLRSLPPPGRDAPLEDLDLSGPELHIAEDEDLYRRIRSTWPAGSLEQQVLLGLTGPTTPRQLAHQLGIPTRRLMRTALRAWLALHSERDG